MARNLNNCTITLSGELNNSRRNKRSYESVFTGTAGRHFFMMLGTSLFSIIPFIGLPNAICVRQRWNCKHTKIVGMTLKFEGKASELLGKMFVWGFFSVITLGIYAAVLLPVRYKQWITKNTIFGPVA